MLQLHCTISHLLSIESWLHTGTAGALLFARKEKLKQNQVQKQNTQRKRAVITSYF